MVHAAWAHNTIFAMTLKGLCNGQSIVTTHHFEASAVREALLLNDGLAQTSGANLAADWKTNCQASFLATRVGAFSLTSVDVQVVQRPGVSDHVLVATTNTTGLPAGGTFSAGTGSVDDMTTSAVIKWRSLLAGKSRRGRNYIGPLHQDQAESGSIIAATITAINAYITAMARYIGAGAAAADWIHTIYSRPYNTGQYQYTKRVGGVLTVVTPTDYNGDSNFVTTGLVDSTARVQRRRELGVGA